MSNLNHIEVLKEAVSIRRGTHPGWRGDRIANGEFFLESVGRDFGEDAVVLVEGVRNNVSDFADVLGVSVDMVQHYVSLIEKGHKFVGGRDAIEAYYSDRTNSKVHASLS